MKANKPKTAYLIRLLSVVSLLAVVFCCVGFCQKYLCLPNDFDENRVIEFHKEPADSIDVLFIGSSSVYTAFSSAYAYGKFGFTSYPYALSGASCIMWKPALQDALKTQKPKLVVVDVFGGGYDADLLRTRNAPLYRISNNTPLSPAKVRNAVDINGMTEQTSTVSLIFPFFKYHRRLLYDIRKIPENIIKKQAVLSSGPSPLKGIETRTKAKKLGDLDEASFTSDSEDLDPDTEAVIRDFIDYCKSEDIDVLFVKFPSILTGTRKEKERVNLRANRVLEMGRDSGYAALNLQPLFYEMGLVKDEDFYNHDHANIRGQKKITEYLGRYIQDDLGIGPSHLDPDVKAEWDQSVKYYDALAAMAEECIENGEDRELGDSPGLADELRDRIGR